jgi:Lrp/AsnC family leucine-responsive transcriptional regulator
VRSEDLDLIDWEIIRELQADARLSFNELGRRVHLSAPSVAERVRRLETRGVITGYSAQIDRVRAGQPVLCFIQLRCRTIDCLLRTTTPEDFPELIEVQKLSGEYCTLLKAATASLDHLEELTERLGKHGDIRTHIVMSTQYEGRPVTRIEHEPVPKEYNAWRGRYRPDEERARRQ